MSDTPEKHPLYDWFGRFLANICGAEPKHAVERNAFTLVGFLFTLLFLIVVGTIVWVVLATSLNTALGTNFANADPTSDQFKNNALILGAVSTALFATWRGIVATKNARISQGNLELNQQRDLTDRFIKAVELLGATRTDADGNATPALEQRLGAIYALEQLSKESETHHIQIMEVLCAYIRTNAPADGTRWPGAILRELERDNPSITDDEINENEKFRIAIEGTSLTIKRLRDGHKAIESDPVLDDWINQKDTPNTDIQVILDVIGRRSDEMIAYERARTPAYRLDLRRANLRRADCSGKKLDHTLFSGSLLGGAEFHNTQIEGAEFREVQMESAGFMGTQMKRADFHRAQMEWVVFSDAQMEEVEFRNSQMARAGFFTTQMERARFFNTQMERAEFIDTQMQGTEFNDTQMAMTLFGNMQMEKVEFRRTRMEKVKFHETQMEGLLFIYSYMNGTPEAANVLKSTNLNAAVNDGGALRFVDLSQAEINETTDFRNAFGDGSVTLPETMQRPPHWPIEHLDDTNFFGRWRGWVECGPDPDIWEYVAPEGYEDVPPIAPDKRHKWVKRETEE